MNLQEDTDFSALRPLRDVVVVCRPLDVIKPLAKDPLYGGTVEADFTEIPSGLVLPGHGKPKNRVQVFAVGPKCTRLQPGMFVLIPPDRDKQGRRCKGCIVQRGTQFMFYAENDLVLAAEHIKIPAEWLEPEPASLTA